MMKEFPLSKVYQLLEPGPVVLLTTASNGKSNVMATSWHMMVEFEPPLVACVVSVADHSFAASRRTRECVIAIPALQLAPTVVQVWGLGIFNNCRDKQVARQLTRIWGDIDVIVLSLGREHPDPECSGAATRQTYGNRQGHRPAIGDSCRRESRARQGHRAPRPVPG